MTTISYSVTDPVPVCHIPLMTVADEPMGRAARLRDVAAAAGVSITTASHALNGLGRVSAETRQHVLDVAQQLGYKANLSARLMRTGNSGLLGVLNRMPTGETDDPLDIEYMSRVNQGACGAALTEGFFPVTLPLSHAELLRQLPLDGAVVVDPLRDDPLLTQLHLLGIPYVSIGHESRPAGGSVWSVDNAIADVMRALLGHLHEVGARRITVVMPRTDQSYVVEAAATFDGWCADRRLTGSVVLLPPDEEQPDRRSLAESLTGQDRPDGLVIMTERLVAPCMAALARAGLAVPADIRVVAALDNAGARMSDPPLTAMDVAPVAIGESAIRLLLSHLRDPGAVPQQLRVPATLVVRASTTAG